MIRIYLIILIGSIPFWGSAQDMQFSQFYANVLYTNPAFSGAVNQFRASMDYRHQWTNLDNAYNTAFFSADYNFASASSGAGIYFLNDRAGEGNYQTNEVALQYSYKINLDKYNAIRLGLQPSYVLRSVNYNAFVFGDQLEDDGDVNGESLENFGDKGNLSYFDVGVGALYYNELFWAGISAHHLNTPPLSFRDSEEQLPMKLSVHLGGQIRLLDDRNQRFYIIPAANYKMQGFYDQLDVGVYVNYNSFVGGLWYRGLPIKNAVPGTANHDAVVVLLGVSEQNFSFGYSYDVGISKLTNTVMGAHELSIRYEIGADKKSREVPIPKY